MLVIIHSTHNKTLSWTRGKNPNKYKYMHYLTVDGFYPRAKQLRGVFDRRFEEPLRARTERFVWDYWHVPGEYTQLRTPAFQYFPQAEYARFHRHLVRFGREQLGCHDISPPWLSCYIEGCRQEAHQDLPHGPIAFVFSLTNWKSRKFRGGETFIVKPKTLIEPKFNRLTLFNPALTHGVREVRGTHDPREGRLVMNGWFVNPRPFWTGPLTAAEVQTSFDEGLANLDPRKLEPGFASYRMNISTSGRVTGIKTLIDTFATPAMSRSLERELKGIRFARKKAASRLTFPLRID